MHTTPAWAHTHGFALVVAQTGRARDYDHSGLTKPAGGHLHAGIPDIAPKDTRTHNIGDRFGN